MRDYWKLGVAAVMLCLGAADPAPQIVTVPVGDTMLSTGGTKVIKGIVLADEDNILHRRFSAGFYPQLREDARYSWHSFLLGSPSNGLGALTGLRDARTLRADKDGQKLCVGLGAMAMGLKACDSEHSYLRVERTVPDPATEHQELTYDGLVGHVLRLGYSRTTPGEPGRATSQEAEYDLAVSNLLTFREARIRVIKADAGSVTFVVVKPLG